LLAHNHWQTLDGRWTYNLHKNQTLRIVNVSSNPGSSADPRHEQKAVCHSVIDMAESNAARVVAHVSHGWCVLLFRFPIDSLCLFAFSLAAYLVAGNAFTLSLRTDVPSS
jgi:hypothetical protein